MERCCASIAKPQAAHEWNASSQKIITESGKGLQAWWEKRGLRQTGGAIDIAEDIDQADNNEALLQIMSSMANLKEESENNDEEKSQSVLHNTKEDEESIFLFSQMRQARMTYFFSQQLWTKMG